MQALTAAPAMAATPRVFDLPSLPVAEALIALALQSGVTIGVARECRGRSAPVTGAVTVENALTRLLAGSGCTFQRVDRQTFRVVKAPAPVAKPPPVRPAPLPVAAVEQVPPLETIDDIVITAPRRPTLSEKFPGAASAVSSQALMRSGATDSSAIFGLLAGVSMTNLGPGRDKIMLRGLSDGTFTGRTQSTVGIYLDKSPITYNAPDPNLRLADVNGIEILRGPQGSLYGGGSISGIFRIAPRPPVLNQFGGAILLGASFTKSGDPSSEVEATVNLPLMTDRAALRAVAYRDVQGGYIDDVNLSLSNIDRTTRIGGRAAVLALTPNDWRVTLAGAYQEIDGEDTQYITPAMGRLRRSNEVREGHGNQFALVSLGVEGDQRWGSFSFSAALLHNEIATRADASRALPLFGAGAPAVGAHDRSIVSNLATFDLTFTSTSGGRTDWLIGASGVIGRERLWSEVSMNPNVPGATAVYLEHRQDHRKEIAFYGEYTYTLAPRLRLTAGVRVYTSSVDTESLVQHFPGPQERNFRDDADFSGWLPKLALQFEPSAVTMVYLQASTGRRLGGFNTAGPLNQQFLLQPGRAGVYREFQPDRLRSFEAGIKTRLPAARVRVRAAVFHADWRNIQTDGYLISGLSYTANAGDGRNLGLEAELAAGPFRGVELQLNGIVNDPKLTRPSPSFAAAKNVGLPGVPDVSVGGQLSYEKRLGSRFTALFSLQGQFIGHSRPTFDRFSTRMGGYVLSRLSASLSTQRWSIRLDVANPTNEAGDTFSYGNPFNFRSTREMTPQRPRTIRLSVQAGF